MRRRIPVDYSKCNQTITIYHENNGVYEKTVCRAFFDFKKAQSLGQSGKQENNTSLIVIPIEAQPVFVGDKVVLGIGEEITTREAWAKLIPSVVPNMCNVRYVDPKYFGGKVIHWECGG